MHSRDTFLSWYLARSISSKCPFVIAENRFGFHSRNFRFSVTAEELNEHWRDPDLIIPIRNPFLLTRAQRDHLIHPVLLRDARCEFYQSVPVSVRIAGGRNSNVVLINSRYVLSSADLVLASGWLIPLCSFAAVTVFVVINAAKIKVDSTP